MLFENLINQLIAPAYDLIARYLYRDYTKYKCTIGDIGDQTRFTIFVNGKEVDGAFDRTQNGGRVYLKPEQIVEAFIDVESF